VHFLRRQGKWRVIILAEYAMRLSRAVTLLLPILSLLTTTGCAHRAKVRAQQAALKAQKDQPAWVDAKDVCVFRYGERKLPKNATDFDHALTKGWERSFKLPDMESTVRVEGGERYPRIKALKIDLTDARVEPESRSARLRPTDKRLSGSAVHATSFELVSHPLRSGKAKVDMNVTARDVRLDFGKDREDQPMLLMTDAKDGHMEIAVAHEDVERILLEAAKEKASKFGIDVRKLSLTMVSDPADRSVRVGVKTVSLVGGFVPAGLTFSARLDIDEKLNGTLSGLTCDGDNVLGPLISGIIRPGLKKHEGQTRPLVKFPLGTMHLRDAQIITADNTIKLTAAFGS
jgi:hypothetical protein